MLVSVDEVKAHLRIDQDEEDLYLGKPDPAGAGCGGGLLPGIV